MKHEFLKPLSVALAATAFLTACGGGGGGSAAVAPIEPKYQNVAGPVDPVQDGLTAVGTSAAATPAVGASLQTMTESLVCLTDAVDVLAGSLQSLAATQDPQQFAQLQSQLGPALECAAEELTAALEGLSAPGLPTSSGPSAATAQDLLAQLDALQSLLGDSGSTPGDLTAVTDVLVDIANELALLVTQVPPVPNAPQIEVLTSALSVTFFNIATVLDEAGALDSNGFNLALSDTVSDLTAIFTSTSLTGNGVVDAGFQTAATGIVTAAAPVQAALLDGVETVSVPLFDALQTVLGSVGGSNMFAGAVSGLLPGDASTPSLDPVLGLLDGGGSTSGGTPVPTLDSVLNLLGLG